MRSIRRLLIHVIEPSLTVSMETLRRECGEARAALCALAQQFDTTGRLITDVRVGRVAESIAKAIRGYGGDLVVIR